MEFQLEIAQNNSYTNALSDAMRVKEIIEHKTSINEYYKDAYIRYQQCLQSCGEQGMALEIGSGMGPVKKYIQELITTDVIPYPNLDMVIDATQMPFENNSIKFICMLNVFHHIPNVEKFLAEAQRCLRPGGKLLIIDQHPGLLGKIIFKYLHHEYFEPKAANWDFKSTDPLNDANGALAWIVFRRDLKLFETKFPSLKITQYKTHTPLFYWLSGGLKNWTLLKSNGLVSLAKAVDKFIALLLPTANCFVDIVVEKK